jgi:tetratricopeptide (TPR) repeat protein
MLQQDLTTTAQRRQTDAPKLIHLVRGDLDWIVMKCLEKDRTRRYETANGLAMDVRRYLNDEPVLARPPSNVYRLQKLVRRNRAAVTAVAAVCLALVVGFGLSLYLFIQERQALHRAVAAEREQARLRKQAEDALAIEAQLRGRAQVADTWTAAGRLVSEGRFDEAEPLLYKINDPSTAPLLNSIGMARARTGDWNRAATNFSRLLDLVPTEVLPYYYLAPFLLEMGDEEAYERHRQRILRQFPDAQLPMTVERLLKACMLLPLEQADRDGVEALGKTLANAPPRMLNQDVVRVVRGLYEYREGHYQRALALLENVASGQQATNPALPIQAWLISAMAQARLGQTEEARATLDRCGPAPAEKATKAKNRDFGTSWPDSS